MDPAIVGRREASVTTCGCAGSPRRACDVCRSAHHAFLACSLLCLTEHQTKTHGESTPQDAETRARQFQREMNRVAPSAWNRYESHRLQTMGWATAITGARNICVFGAGNCADVDLERLSRSFERVHLVDLDGDALERARDRQPTELREQIVLHPNVDLSGLLGHLDDWGENFPADGELGPAAVGSAHQIVRQLGQTFDVTLSSCVLSQLIMPYQHTWVMPQSNWAKLDAVVTAVHLATLAGATSSGGRGFIAFDVLSSDDAPGLRDFSGRSSEELVSFVAREVELGNINLQPDPSNLLLQLGSPGLASLMASPRLTLPWLWDISSALQLVYGLSFRRP